VNEASFTLNQFLLYILAEDPDLKKGDTFRAEEDMEKFNLSKRSSSEFFEADSLYFNSFGIWQLNSPLP
ncbi:MAG: hypothetical protein ACTIMQ_04625, partial [Acinetobacter guillouiae]